MTFDDLPMEFALVNRVIVPRSCVVMPSSSDNSSASRSSAMSRCLSTLMDSVL